MMDNTVPLQDALIAVVAVVILGWIICDDIYTKETDKLITACESNLPRDQKCVLVAVKESNK